MEINYSATDDERLMAPFWQSPNPDIVLRDTMIPPIYAPYGTPSYWPPATNWNNAKYQLATQVDPATGTMVNIIGSFPQGLFPAGSTAAGAGTMGTAMSGIGDGTAPTVITPASVASAVPTIVSGTGASQPIVQQCSGISSWVGQNPLTALIGVAVLFTLVHHASKKKETR